MDAVTENKPCRVYCEPMSGSAEDELIAERDREWGLALAGIGVASLAASVRHGSIKVERD